MNRTAVVIGLGLSLLLHSGLFLLSVSPSDPLAATKLKVTLQRILPQSASHAPLSPPSRTENPPLPEPLLPKPEPAGPPKPARQPPRLTKPPRDLEQRAKPDPQPLPAPRTATRPTRRLAEPEPAPHAPESRPVAAPATSSPAVDRIAAVPTVRAEKITPPAYIPRTPPYPKLAKQRGWEGKVQLQVDVSPDGRVSNASIQESSGYQVLDRSALQHIRKSRFRPARKNGKAVEMSILVPVVYQLN